MFCFLGGKSAHEVFADTCVLFTELSARPRMLSILLRIPSFSPILHQHSLPTNAPPPSIPCLARVGCFLTLGTTPWSCHAIHRNPFHEPGTSSPARPWREALGSSCRAPPTLAPRENPLPLFHPAGKWLLSRRDLQQGSVQTA